MRYILVSFLLMGWAFYEFSGGSDFDPDVVRETRMEALSLKEPAPVAAAPIAIVEKAPLIVAEPETPGTVQRPPLSLNLTSLRTDAQNTPTHKTVAAPKPEAKPQDLTEIAVNVALEEALSDVQRSPATITSSADTPAIIPSLIAPREDLPELVPIAAQPTETVPAPERVEDIRTVSGNRVNVRGGPGTDFSIVGRLTAGDQIRVLEDNGAGWVRFDTPGGGTAGWMADFLLNSG